MYTDAWDTKGPLVYYIAALLNHLAGPSALVFRLFDLSVHVTGAILIANLASRIVPTTWSGWAAAGFYVLWVANFDFWNTAQPDSWAGVCLVGGALALVTTESLSNRRVFLAGLALGIPLLVKPTYLVMGAIAVPPALQIWRREGMGPCLQRSIVFLSGLCLPIIVAAGVFALSGTLNTAIDVYLGYTRRVYAGLSDPWMTRFQDGFAALLTQPWAVSLPLGMIGFWTLWRTYRTSAWSFLLWVSAALFGIIAQGKVSWAYHWWPLVAPLAIFSGIGVGALWRKKDGAMHAELAVLRVSMLVWAIVVAAFVPMQTLYRWSKHVVGLVSTDAYEAQEYGYWGRQSTGSIYAIARYIKAHTAPTDQILVIAMEPWINILAERKSPTRFGVVRPLFDSPQSPYRGPYRTELISAMDRSAPAYVVTLDAKTCATLGNCAETFPELYTRLLTQYVPEDTVGGRVLWKRQRILATSLSPRTP